MESVQDVAKHLESVQSHLTTDNLFADVLCGACDFSDSDSEWIKHPIIASNEGSSRGLSLISSELPFKGTYSVEEFSNLTEESIVQEAQSFTSELQVTDFSADSQDWPPRRTIKKKSFRHR